ncbi:hypothetical protein PAHAL_5G514700 [Panicum hallii]|uniref:Protein kinase domain-containing protein n=1 Tax=Panicum hallii TaxID=206008 RepID=A0A2T8IP90_9POAL|nr:hypothetical protein PAHAL_5G514700 [Panicum hallii]
MAPEWLTSQITKKVDVYSFGVVVMEIICGRSNLDYSQPERSIQLISLLQEKAKKNELDDMIDRNSEDMYIHKEEVIEMMNLAIWCLESGSNRRPAMSLVVKVLEGESWRDQFVNSAYSISAFCPESKKLDAAFHRTGGRRANGNGLRSGVRPGR